MRIISRLVVHSKKKPQIEMKRERQSKAFFRSAVKSHDHLDSFIGSCACSFFSYNEYSITSVISCQNLHSKLKSVDFFIQENKRNRLMCISMQVKMCSNTYRHRDASMDRSSREWKRNNNDLLHFPIRSQ